MNAHKEAAANLAARAILGIANVKSDINGDYDPPYEDTPRRFANALNELLRGHLTEPPHLRTFDYDGPPQLVTSYNNQAYCLCPHHLLAVELSCSIGYVVGSAIVGLSKIPRLIAWASSRLITQEELALDLLKRLSSATSSTAIFVHIKGSHSCMRARGIKTRGTVTTYVSSTQQSPWESQFLTGL